MIKLLFPILLALWMAGCKPEAFPKHPDYAVHPPTVKYAPSRQNLAKMVKQLQGSPYVWAEEGPDKFDCSGLTYYVYGSMGIELPRTAREQARVGKRVRLSELQYGDLLFFATSRRHPHKITHVGIYLGDGWFTHASTVKKEVIYSNLYQSRYYQKHLRLCRRYLPDETQPIASTTPFVSTQDATSTAAPAPKQKHAVVVASSDLDRKLSHTKRGHFFVQAGSFRGKPNAAFVRKIRRHGYRYRLLTFRRNGTRINKLLIGPYATKAEAHEALKTIRRSVAPQAFLAEIR